MKKSQADYFGKLFEQLSYVKQIKLFGLFDVFPKRLQKPFDCVMSGARKYQNVSYCFLAIDTLIVTTANVFLFVFGGMQVIKGTLSIGSFTIISSYFAMLISSIRYFLSLGKNIQDAKVSYDRLYDLLSHPSEVNGSKTLEEIHTIRFSNVSFIADGKIILNDLNKCFAKGNIYCIKGQNGSGKSTFANILIGLLQNVCVGEVLYNEIRANTVDVYALRKELIGVVEQEPILFDDTILFNITLGEEISRHDLEKLIKALNLQDFIDSLPDGLNTNISGKFTVLSGGEKQKISILRAFVKNPEVLIMDEPTSALDSSSIQNLKKYLMEIKKERIIIIITHDEDFSTIADETVFF